MHPLEISKLGITNRDKILYNIILVDIMIKKKRSTLAVATMPTESKVLT